MRTNSFKIKFFIIGMLLAVLTIISFNSFGQEDIERYKLYPVAPYNNKYKFNNHLKLDTKIGKIWYIQIESGLEKKSYQQLIIDRQYGTDDDIYDYSKDVIGRYKLYPTSVASIFILQDVIEGNTFRVNVFGRITPLRKD